MPGSGRHVRSPRMAADEKGRVFHYGHRGCADRDSEPVYLSRFLLDAALQGKGLGTELYREFEEMQRRRGRKGIRIDVVDDYEGNLVPFWKRRGFEEGEEITLEWGGKASRARVMYRNLI